MRIRSLALAGAVAMGMAAALSAAGIDAMNMHQTDWNGGQVVLFHRFGVLAFSWDLQFDYQLASALRMGVDAVYSDNTAVMVDVHATEVGRPRIV